MIATMTWDSIRNSRGNLRRYHNRIFHSVICSAYLYRGDLRSHLHLTPDPHFDPRFFAVWFATKGLAGVSVITSP